MKLPLFKISQTKRFFCARLSTASVFGSLFFLATFPAAAVADVDTDVNAIKIDVQYLRQYVGTLNSSLDNVEEDIDRMDRRSLVLQNFLVGHVSTSSSIPDFNNKNALPYHMRTLLRTSQATTNLLSHLKFKDEMNANPWWATNSEFALVRSDWDSTKVPSPQARKSYSFPEAFSHFATSLYQEDWSNDFRYRVSLWGTGSSNSHFLGVYSWFDWMSDAMKSNWIASQTYLAASSTNELLTDMAGTGAEESVYDEAPSTNAIAALHVDLPDVNDMSRVLEVADVAGDWLPDVAEGDGDARVVLFGGASYGDIRVERVYADLSVDGPTYRLFRRVATWLWRLLLFVGILSVVREEYNYWSTLGGSASA